MPRQRLMTKAEFEAFLLGVATRDGSLKVYVAPPYTVVRCDCGDVNCHGWRFVPATGDNQEGES